MEYRKFSLSSLYLEYLIKWDLELSDTTFMEYTIVQYKLELPTQEKIGLNLMDDDLNMPYIV